MPAQPPRFHAGEIAIQQRDGVSDERRLKAAAAIRPHMPEQHRLFFERLSVLFMGLLDREGRPWATVAAGADGFVRSPDPEHLTIGAKPALARELGLATGAGDKVGVLGIELPTRRRNRMNGAIIGAAEGGGLVVKVDQSFGNCDKYIQTRAFDRGADFAPTACLLDALSRSALDILRMADTLFIASRAADLDAGAATGLDVSHRGGRPGFLHVNGDGSLSFPDFAGNRFFNTLGNIADDGRVGLMVPRFDTGDAVYLTGRASVDWESERVKRFEGAERIVDVRPTVVYLVRHALPVTATLIESSPSLAGTGEWPETAPISLARLPSSQSEP